MRIRPSELKTLFKRFKDGDPAALEGLLKSEEPRLFDYLMRMTGQVSRSMETLKEASNAVIPVADQEANLQDFLVLLYKTTRGFTFEIWNAETSRLENGSYISEESELSDKMKAQLVELEKVVRSLPARQREVLLLQLRFGFDEDEIIEITGYELEDVEELFEQGANVIEAALSISSGKMADLISKMLFFPIPVDENDGTQNLSLVVRDLKKSSRRTPGGLLRLLSGAAFVALIVYAAWNHELVFEYIQQFIDR